MRPVHGGQMARRAVLAAALVVITGGAVAVAAADSGSDSRRPGIPVEMPRQVLVESASPSVWVANVSAVGYADVAELVVPEGVPAPADVVRETGSWFAHGTTLDLLADGTGTLATWVGAVNGDRISLRLIPAPGEATVAEIVGIETIGQGALGEARPGVGGLVTVAFGAQMRTAHVEWTSGAQRHAVDLCPVDGLDAAAMEALSCGA